MATNAHVHAIWLPLRLPALALECLGIYASSDQAVMVIDKQLVCAATQALQAVGIHIGMPVNTAQLIYDESKHKDGECYSYERGPQREAKTLKKISDELYSFTPYINTHRVNTSDNIQACGLQLELSRCIRLFKGLKPLLQNIATLMESYKIHFHYGLSHTPSGSWLLSYHENTQALPETQRLDIQQSIQNIHALPINYLHQHQNQLEALSNSGFTHIGNIAKQLEKNSVASMRKRFRHEVIDDMLDIFHMPNIYQQNPQMQNSSMQTALFTSPTPVYQPEEAFIENIQFDLPVSNSEHLHEYFKRLLQQLADKLREKQQQTQKITWVFYDIYQKSITIEVNFERLHHDIRLALELSLIKLENQPLPFEIDSLELQCHKRSAVENHNSTLFSDSPNEQQSTQHVFAVSVEKIRARLGAQAMFVLVEKDSHIPEISFKENSTPEEKKSIKHSKENHKKSPTGNRPTWIFKTPTSIGTRQNHLYWQGQLQLLQGPERIEGLWWKKPTARDYFVAIRDDNVRLWVFNDLHKNEWFIHGVFA